jgi:hypothetical protein
MNVAGGESSVDDDRLPWLETVDDDYEEGSSIWRVVLLVGLALAVVAAAVVGFLRYQGEGTGGGTGALINAQEGDYKIKPDEPGGMQVEGEGDTVFATSEGSVTNSSVDLRAVPESPVSGKSAPAPTATPARGAARVVTNIPDARGTLQAKAPMATPTITPAAGASAGGALIQLGSFPTEAGANAAWTQLSKRFGYIASLGKSVQKAEVNGRTVYRLRVNAGSNAQAGDLCGKLKVAGENCFVAR